MIPRIKICEVCGNTLKKTYRDITKIHACESCCRAIELFERKAKRIFGA